MVSSVQLCNFIIRRIKPARARSFESQVFDRGLVHTSLRLCRHAQSSRNAVAWRAQSVCVPGYFRYRRFFSPHETLAVFGVKTKNLSSAFKGIRIRVDRSKLFWSFLLMVVLIQCGALWISGNQEKMLIATSFCFQVNQFDHFVRSSDA